MDIDLVCDRKGPETKTEPRVPPKLLQTCPAETDQTALERLPIR